MGCHGARGRRHGVLACHPVPSTVVGQADGGRRRSGGVHLVLPCRELPVGGHHERDKSPHGSAGERVGRPLVPRAVPTRSALHARGLGGPHGSGRCLGDRPPLRPLRRGVVCLRALGSDRDVDLGQPGRADLTLGSGAGRAGDIDGRGGRLPGSSGAGCLVPRRLHRPSRCRRLHRRARWPRRGLRRRSAAVPCRQPHQPYSRRRLSRLRRQLEHGAPR